jgi:pimeloyl-ACP methyl ester carboxylesterase/quercetin dioxygenase-like cupin family protein
MQTNRRSPGTAQALARVAAVILLLSLVPPLRAEVQPFPRGFATRTIANGDARIFVRVGGRGPAVVLLHGYGETGDMWAPLAVELARDHTVIVPDLRGMGLSSHPAGGYDKKTQAGDVSAVLDALGVGQVALVTHDIGNMVGYAFAAEQPVRVTRFALLDAPIPGVGPWEEILKSPLLWHFRFGGPDMERLVKGRERIYLDRFWNEFSADPKRFDEASRRHYAALYARPGAMHSGFEQFKAFDQDAIDNRAFLAAGRLTMPVLAVGGEKSFGATMAVVMRAAATNVRQLVIADSGHWLMEESPAATTAAVAAFLRDAATSAPAAIAATASLAPLATAPKAGEAPLRLTALAIAALDKGGAGAGTSGVGGIESVVLSGDPTKQGPYTIAVRVPPHTRIAAHRHRDDRSAVVVSGTWYLGYGTTADQGLAEPLGPGSYYTEPGDEPHFAATGDEPAVVYITGFGPTDTRYVEAAADPRRP